MLPPPWAEAVERLQTIPGIDRRAAENIGAEIGPDPQPFASAGHLASWVGICPGNHESAGKRRRGRTTRGHSWLRVTLVQCAWAASHTKGTYLSAQYERLAARRGTKRALVSLGHRLLDIGYAALKKRTAYRELGADYLDRPDQEQRKARLLRRLAKLGVKVIGVGGGSREGGGPRPSSARSAGMRTSHAKACPRARSGQRRRFPRPDR